MLGFSNYHIGSTPSQSLYYFFKYPKFSQASQHPTHPEFPIQSPSHHPQRSLVCLQLYDTQWPQHPYNIWSHQIKIPQLPLRPT